MNCRADRRRRPPIRQRFRVAAAAGAEAGLGWISLMEVNEEGAFRPTLHNVKLIVRNDPRFVGLAQINEFTQETVQRISPGHKEPRRKNQAKPTLQLEGRIWTSPTAERQPVVGRPGFLHPRAHRSAADAGRLRHQGVRPRPQGGDRHCGQRPCLSSGARVSRRPEWDGKPRVERLFVDYLGSEPNPYTLSVARLFMTAAVTRIFEPGHKFDFAVILEGLQGKRKSTFIQVLGRAGSPSSTAISTTRKA
jgi:hypothetical protein